jgi:hypothetical protein
MLRSKAGEPAGLILLESLVELGSAAGDFAYACLDGLGFECGDRDLPGRRLHQLRCGKNALADRLVDRPDAEPSRIAAASALIVSARGGVGSKAPIPSRSRSSRTRTVVQALPWAGLRRIRFNVTASSQSGDWPPPGSGGDRPGSVRSAPARRAIRCGACRSNGSCRAPRWCHRRGRARLRGSGYG